MRPEGLLSRHEFSPLAVDGTGRDSCGVLKKCALVALNVIAEAGRGGEDGCHAPGPGNEWKMGCPKSPIFESEGEAWSEDESVSSSGFREGNVCNDALRVIGLYGPGDKIFLVLQDWELAKMALSCHMACTVPGN